MGEDARGLRYRKADLARLRSHATRARKTGRACLLAVSGRRMVGKSTLVERMRLDSRSQGAFFTARRDEDSRRALARFLEELRRGAPREVAAAEAELSAAGSGAAPPTSWRDALLLAAHASQAITEAYEGEVGCVTIDELPSLLEQEPELEQQLLAAWEAGLSELPILLVLIGADEHAITSLSEKGRPLARVLEQIDIQPLSPPEVAKITGRDAKGALDAWCAIGGLPQLLCRWQHGESLTSYLKRELSDPTSPLVVCGERIVTAELPPRSAARAVMRAIGEGETEFGRMVHRTRLGRTAVSGALKTQARRGNVLRRVPIAINPDRRLTTYAIADPYLNFWLRFVWRGLPEIERLRGDLVARRVGERWAGFAERAIEPLVLQTLSLIAPGGARAVGLHWTRSTKDGNPLVGADTDVEPSEAAFVGALLWRDRERFGAAEAKELAHLRDSVPYASPKTPLLAVCRAGFVTGSEVDIPLGPEELIHAWRR